LLTCKDFLNELSEYLDESVDLELKVKLEKHVSECPNCWVVFDTTQKTIKVYKGIEPQTVPEDVRSRLMAALQKKIAAGKCQP
jgi:anti-sigma factor (TIGR02949 family)